MPAAIGYPMILHGADGDSCRCGGQERPGIGASRGQRAADQITPEPPEERRPRAGNGTGGGDPPPGPGQVEPAAEAQLRGSPGPGATHGTAAKEGGTAGPPPARLVPPRNAVPADSRRRSRAYPRKA